MKKPASTKGTLNFRKQLLGLLDSSPVLRSRFDRLERFRALLDHANDIILLVRLDSRLIVDANASACLQLGYPSETLVGMPIENVVDFESLEWPEEPSEGTACRTIATFLRLREGGVLPVEMLFCMEEFGESTYIVIVARDITERLRSEEVLRRSEWEKALILESTEELVLFHDRDMRIVWANRAAADAFRLEGDELKGRYCWEIWHHRETPCSKCPVLRAIHTGKPNESEITAADGAVWLVRSYPARNAKGEIEGAVELCLDISDRKRAEEALRESDRMKTDFISTAAHELRTPLTSILGFSQVLLSQQGLSEEEKKEFLTYINLQAKALSDIVSDLLDIARIESGQGLALNREASTPSALVQLLAPFLQGASCQSNRCHCRLDIKAETTPLSVDKGKMVQVFENLLSNAVKYSPEGGSILIIGEVTDEGYRFSIADQGVGMSSEQMARIFDKFYRADASDTAKSGLGLGMSIAKSIVEAHGGRIWVESEPRQGTTVRFTLPIESSPRSGKESRH